MQSLFSKQLPHVFHLHITRLSRAASSRGSLFTWHGWTKIPTTPTVNGCGHSIKLDSLFGKKERSCVDVRDANMHNKYNSNSFSINFYSMAWLLHKSIPGVSNSHFATGSVNIGMNVAQIPAAVLCYPSGWTTDSFLLRFYTEVTVAARNPTSRLGALRVCYAQNASPAPIPDKKTKFILLPQKVNVVTQCWGKAMAGAGFCHHDDRKCYH